MIEKHNPKRHYFLPSQYDIDGHLKPPFIIYLALIYLMRVLIVLAGASGIGSDTNNILKVFYPDHRMLYAHIIVAILALFCGYLIFHRKWLFDHGKEQFFGLLKPLLLTALLTDLSLHIYFGQLQHWQFSLSLGIGVIMPVVFMLLLLSNRTVQHYFNPHFK